MPGNAENALRPSSSATTTTGARRRNKYAPTPIRSVSNPRIIYLYCSERSTSDAASTLCGQAIPRASQSYTCVYSRVGAPSTEILVVSVKDWYARSREKDFPTPVAIPLTSPEYVCVCNTDPVSSLRVSSTVAFATFSSPVALTQANIVVSFPGSGESESPVASKTISAPPCLFSGKPRILFVCPSEMVAVTSKTDSGWFCIVYVTVFTSPAARLMSSVLVFLRKLSLVTVFAY